MENNRYDDIHIQEDQHNEVVHTFSAEYEAQKNKLLDGIKDVEEYNGHIGKGKNWLLSGQFAKVAVILICAVILLPVSIHAAVTVYRFTVSQDGHTATGTIQTNEDGETYDAASQSEQDTSASSSDEKSKAYDADTARRYIEVDFSYLPAGMIRVEESKYDMSDGQSDMGLSIAADKWDGKSYDVVNRDVEKSRTLSAGKYEYLLFERGGVNYSFDRLVYIPVKEHSVIITMYVGRAISETDLTKVIAGMSINEDIGDDPAKWIMVGDYVLDDSYVRENTETDTELLKDMFTKVNVNEEFVRGGYEMTVNDITIYDNICDIPQSDIVYWFGELDSRFVDEYGKFKAVRCRRLIETTDDAFSRWDSYNDSSLRLVAVDMTYKGDVMGGTDEMEDDLAFYLDRGEITPDGGMEHPDTTNYYYSGEDVSAQNSQEMTYVSPAYAEIDGQKAELVDMAITMSRDGEEHDMKVYFLVDESEIKDSYIDITYGGCNTQYFDYATIYLGDEK